MGQSRHSTHVCQMTSATDAEAGTQVQVLWDNPEGWGRRWRRFRWWTHVHPGLIHVDGRNHHNIVKAPSPMKERKKDLPKNGGPGPQRKI